MSSLLRERIPLLTRGGPVADEANTEPKLREG